MSEVQQTSSYGLVGLQKSSNPSIAEKKLTGDEAIYNVFMAQRDLPKWHRGLSQFQMDGADSLLNCIRDDSQQGTSHRVKEALIKLGIDPLVNSRKIKLAMRLSRGNDMAFLWFLMELYYRHGCDNCEHGNPLGYTVNEQVIMSAISHLDQITTLRELDKLLPKQPPQNKITKKKKPRRAKAACILPYFEKQRRPISYGKSLTLKVGDNVAYFGNYDKYLNPNHIVANESNRWYAEHNLNKAEVIATRIVKDQIDEVFQAQGKVCDLVDGERNHIMCSHHITMKSIKDSMAAELEVARQKTCEKYFDLNGRLKDQSYKRIIDQLNAEIENAKEYFNKLTSNIDRMEKQTLVDTTDRRKSSLPGKHRILPNLGILSSPSLHKYDYGHALPAVSRDNFFKASTGHKPYKFNYNKIFDMGAKNPIKDAVSTALNGGSSCNMSINHSRAVQKVCNDIWSTEVQKCKDAAIRKEKLKKKETPPPMQTALKFDLPYYDPHNEELMKTMLYEAIQEMKKNKKFVLASLPDAHKTPLLKEWIRKRYGLVYTREEKKKAFEFSIKVFHVLKKEKHHIRVPHLRELSSKGILTYACKKYLLRKTNHLKERYYHNFKQALLADTRDYWGACKPYHCSLGPPRKSFFVYLPAKENDVHMFKPWKVNEYIHAKEEWDKRQRIKRMQLLY